MICEVKQDVEILRVVKRKAAFELDDLKEVKKNRYFEVIDLNSNRVCLDLENVSENVDKQMFENQPEDKNWQKASNHSSSFSNYPEIEVRFKSQITGYDMNCSEKVEMLKMGLPMSMGCDPQEKLVYWCRICQLELNNEDTVLKHILGNRHCKKGLSLREMIKESGGQN